MRPHIVLTIVRKELMEALRDRRTLFMMIALPLLLYPLLILGLNRLREGQQAATAVRASKVAVWGELPEEIRQRLSGKVKVELLQWAGAPETVRAGLTMNQLVTPPTPPLELDAPAEPSKPKKMPDTAWAKAAQKVILDRQADAVLIAWPGFADRTANGELGVASILYDSVRDNSRKARDRVSDGIRLYRVDLQKQREQKLHLPAGFATGVELQSTNVATEQRKSGMLIGSLLPYMLIMFSVMSGFYAAIDMTAGEKERGTMQTLLCAPVESLEIIGGKFLAVWTISMIATVVNLLSLALTFSQIKMPGMQMSVPPSSYLVAFLMLIPISLMVNSIFLAVGAFAKDFKDGQNFLTPILLGLLVPLSVTMTPGVELDGYLAFVPIVNIALLIKSVFVGEWSADMLFLVLVSSFCYSSLALVFASNVWEKNAVLLGGKESFGSLFDFSRRPGAKPTPAVSLLIFAVVLVAGFYGTLALLKRGLPTVLIVTQYVCFLLPVLLLIRMKGFDFVETLRLRAPSWKTVLGAVLIGCSAWAVAGGLLVRLLPPPESLQKAMERLLMLEDSAVPLWQVWALIALTPAICEELLFRGLIMSGFRRLGMWPAILATSLLFGLAHASIYRLLPTMALGIIFGYAVWKTNSIVAGMICHALNNGLMATMARSKPLIAQLGMGDAKFVPWHIIGICIVLMAAGLWLVQSKEPSTTA